MTRARAALLLGAVLAGGLALRVWAFGGITAAHLGDDTRYVAVARNLAAGHAPEGDAEWFGARVAFLWPVALVFRVADPSDYTAVAWPLVMSLVAVLAAFLVARELAGDRAGLVAAAVVAAAPLEVLMATRLRPDAVMPALVALAVWAALRSRRSARPLAWAAGAGLLLAAAWSAREMALVMVPLVVAAGWGAGRRALVAGIGGALAGLGMCVAALAAVGADPLLPLTGTAGASETRNPVAAWDWGSSYARWLLDGLTEPRSPALGALAVVGAAVVTLAVRRDRRALLPGAWAGWGVVYLEGPALANLSPAPRFLLLASIPAAVLVGIAATHWPLPAAAAVCVAVPAAALLVLAPVPGREHRHENVVLLNRIVDVARREGGPVLTEDYTWWAKSALYRDPPRLPVPDADDPRFLDAAARARRARLEPLPRVAGYRGGLVVTGPVTPRAGWPRNWGGMRARIRAQVPWGALVPLARIDGVVVYRWPAGVPARGGAGSAPVPAR